MVDQVEIDDAAGPSAWKTPFLVLSLRCCQPAHGALGVPTAMLVNRMPLVAMARQVLAAGMDGAPGLWYAEGALQCVATNAFHSLAIEYGEQASDALYAWARRHFASHAQRALWQNWTSFFHLLRNRLDPTDELPPPNPPPLLQPVAQRVGSVVLGHFGREAKQQDEALLDQVHSIGFTEWEKRAIALQQDQPGDFAERDIVSIVALALVDEHACNTWRALDSFLTPAQRTEMRDWYRLVTGDRSLLGPPEVPPASVGL